VVAGRSVVSPAVGRLAAVLAAVLLTACDGGLSSADVAKVHAQATAALDHWAAAVAAVGSAPLVIPVGELTGQIGDWEAAVGDNNKRALMAGRVFTTSILQGDASQDGEVRWPDGTTTQVPVMSAQDAIVAIGATATATCDDCTDLVATEATLTSGPIQTTRGPATAPIWSFAIQGTTATVTRVAIANSVIVSPLPWDPIFSSIGLHLDSAVGALGSKEVTVSFIGAPDPGDKSCGEDYSAEAVESDLAVVVIVARRPHLTIGACSAVGARRTATATLVDVLGARVVLNVQDGQPVPMIVSP
jgi:hypothetical protein